MALDRIVPLPAFDYDTYPYILVNHVDIMDLHSGELVLRLSNLSKNETPFASIERSDLLMTYDQKGVLSLKKVGEARIFD